MSKTTLKIHSVFCDAPVLRHCVQQRHFQRSNDLRQKHEDATQIHTQQVDRVEKQTGQNLPTAVLE